MDVTGGLAEQVAKLPEEIQPVLNQLLDRLDKLEAATVKDVEVIAQRVNDALVPQLQAVTQTINSVADQVMSLLRKIDGASITIKLG